MNATLYGISATPESSRSESAARVIAHVDKYQDIRAVIQRARCADGGDADEPAAPSVTDSLLTPIGRVWKWVFD
jgi:hypothetical protein